MDVVEQKEKCGLRLGDLPEETTRITRQQGKTVLYGNRKDKLPRVEQIASTPTTDLNPSLQVEEQNYIPHLTILVVTKKVVWADLERRIATKAPARVDMKGLHLLNLAIAPILAKFP